LLARVTYNRFQNAHFLTAKVNFLICQHLKNAFSPRKRHHPPGWLFCRCELFVELYAYFVLPHLLISFQNIKIIAFWCRFYTLATPKSALTLSNPSRRRLVALGPWACFQRQLHTLSLVPVALAPSTAVCCSSLVGLFFLKIIVFW